MYSDSDDSLLRFPIDDDILLERKFWDKSNCSDSQFRKDRPWRNTLMKSYKWSVHLWFTLGVFKWHQHEHKEGASLPWRPPWTLTCGTKPTRQWPNIRGTDVRGTYRFPKKVRQVDSDAGRWRMVLGGIVPSLHTTTTTTVLVVTGDLLYSRHLPQLQYRPNPTTHFSFSNEPHASTNLVVGLPATIMVSTCSNIINWHSISEVACDRKYRISRSRSEVFLN